MNDKPLITVIVPVYNVEQYLRRCVESIACQTYDNLEILLVDDGSSDGSAELCRTLEKEDKRIKAILKENSGVANTRNAGLDNATGEYIGFIDSDDWIEKDMYEKLYNLSVEENADIAACAMMYDFESGKSVSSDTVGDGATRCVFNTEDALFQLNMQSRLLNGFPQKLFKSSVLEDIRCTPGNVYEDYEVMPSCFIKSDRVAYINDPLYHYCIRKKSITSNKYNRQIFLNYDLSFKRMDFYKKNCEKYYDSAVADHLRIGLACLAGTAALKGEDSKRKEMSRELKSLDVKNAVGYLPLFYKAAYFVLKLGLPLFDFLGRTYLNSPLYQGN